MYRKKRKPSANHKQNSQTKNLRCVNLLFDIMYITTVYFMQNDFSLYVGPAPPSVQSEKPAMKVYIFSVVSHN